MSDGIILRAADVCRLLGVSNPCLYRMMKRGEFPRGIKLSVRVVGWKREDVLAWIEERQTASSDRREA